MPFRLQGLQNVSTRNIYTTKQFHVVVVINSKDKRWNCVGEIGAGEMDARKTWDTEIGAMGANI